MSNLKGFMVSGPDLKYLCLCSMVQNLVTLISLIQIDGTLVFALGFIYQYTVVLFSHPKYDHWV